MFQNGQELQFVPHPSAEVAGEVAWVCVDENILDVQTGTAVAAVNVFVRRPEQGWRMVVHHASVVEQQHGRRPEA